MTAFIGTIPTIASGDTTTVPTNLATYRDALKALSEARTAYTPAWTATTTNPVVNNGTITGRYSQVNKFVTFSMKLTIGSTTTAGTGSYKFSLPVAPHASDPCHFDMFFSDASSGAVYRGISFGVSGSVVFLAYDANGVTGSALGGVSNTNPFTPATSDFIEMWGTYEAA